MTALTALIALIVSACGAAPDDTAHDNGDSTIELDRSDGDADVTVSLDGLTFSPSTVEIEVGETVEFVNAEQPTHDVEFADGESSEPLAEGEVYTRTFDEAGEFDFVCTFHPSSMHGTVIVSDNDNDRGDSADRGASRSTSQPTHPPSLRLRTMWQ